MVRKKCKQCGTSFTRYTSECKRRVVKYCSSPCARAAQIGRPHKCSPRNLSVKPCEFCGTDYMPRHSGSRFCKRSCMRLGMRGSLSAHWKGGRHVDADGYVWVRAPEHPRAKGFGYVKEHKIVMEQQIGRYLRDDESVHHIDGDRANNDPANLQLRGKRHGNGFVQVCGDCGSHNVIALPIATKPD